VCTNFSGISVHGLTRKCPSSNICDGWTSNFWIQTSGPNENFLTKACSSIPAIPVLVHNIRKLFPSSSTCSLKAVFWYSFVLFIDAHANLTFLSKDFFCNCTAPSLNLKYVSGALFEIWNLSDNSFCSALPSRGLARLRPDKSLDCTLKQLSNEAFGIKTDYCLLLTRYTFGTLMTERNRVQWMGWNSRYNFQAVTFTACSVSYQFFPGRQLLHCWKCVISPCPANYHLGSLEIGNRRDTILK